MTDLRQAAQQALEALEWHYRQGHSDTLGGLRLKIDEKAIRTLKAALTQPEQEPVAWMYPSDLEKFQRAETFAQAFSIKVGCPDEVSVPLYTTPPAAQWDKPSASFDEWWDSDVMPSANPFAEGSAAYWAWAGWQAAQPKQEPVISAWSLREVYFDEDGEPLMHRSPPAAQRPWVGLEIEEVQDSYNSDYQAQTRAVEAKLKERNNG
jgi:hypothetical protein